MVRTRHQHQDRRSRSVEDEADDVVEGPLADRDEGVADGKEQEGEGFEAGFPIGVFAYRGHEVGQTGQGGKRDADRQEERIAYTYLQEKRRIIGAAGDQQGQERRARRPHKGYENDARGTQP